MGTSATVILRDVPYQIKGDVIVVDQGAQVALRDGLNPTLAIGDFDSTPVGLVQQLIDLRVPLEQVSSIKDQSDSELTIRKLLKMGYTRIHVYGALAGRLDHQHINLQLAYRHPEVVLYNEKNQIQGFGPGTYVLKPEGFYYVSFFTYETARISLHGFKYALENYRLNVDELKTLSNEWVEETGQLVVHEGHVLVYRTKD